MAEDTVRLEARAKVNLFLRVLSRGTDGYHGIETLFCLVDLADGLAATRTATGTVTIEVSGADAGPAAQNLAARAAERVVEATGRRFGVHLALEKRIPVQAGLGGGSSDAAAALIAVNRLANDAVPRHELLQFAAHLGSDVPFFLSGAPLALAWNRGERMIRLSPLPAAPMLLLIPPIGIPTPEAYQWVDATRPTNQRGAIALDLDSIRTWGDVARMSGNDFEAAVFGKQPAIHAAFEAMVATRPVLCRMSGSGSAVVGVYRSSRDRADARDMLGRKHGQVIETGTAGLKAVD
jgi:4-diphosphocytidyl-2-C-methyl-D-erythritol kinase